MSLFKKIITILMLAGSFSSSVNAQLTLQIYYQPSTDAVEGTDEFGRVYFALGSDQVLNYNSIAQYAGLINVHPRFSDEAARLNQLHQLRIPTIHRRVTRATKVIWVLQPREWEFGAIQTGPNITTRFNEIARLARQGAVVEDAFRADAILANMSDYGFFSGGKDLDSLRLHLFDFASSDGLHTSDGQYVRFQSAFSDLADADSKLQGISTRDNAVRVIYNIIPTHTNPSDIPGYF